MICKSVAFFVHFADDFALHYKITIIVPCNYAGNANREYWKAGKMSEKLSEY